MTGIRKITFYLICFLLVSPIFSVPATASETSDRANILAEIDQYVMNRMNDNNISGAALALTYGNEVFYTKGFGTFSDGRDITEKTHFPIASLSKSFTALAVLQLVDQGHVNLDEPLLSYFPDISPEDDRVNHITIRHLLNHTSGLTDQVNPDMTRSSQFASLQEITTVLNQVRLASNPGEAYSYHNPNYQYLALLVEQISGQRFSHYLQDQIFTPLDMNCTFAVSNTQQINGNPAIPRGHYLLLGQSVAKDEPDWFIEGPAGVISTAEDMAKWMLAQLNAQLLSPDLMGEFHATGSLGRYGMGWQVRTDEHAGKSLSHGGIFWTYKAETTIHLDQQVGITMMFDTGLNAFVDYASFIRDIAQIIQGEKAETTFVTGNNLEWVMVVLIIGTIIWGIYSLFARNKRRNNTVSPKILIFASVRTFLPILIITCLSPISTFLTGGRVLPWHGIWTTLPSLIIWLAVLSLVQLVHLLYWCKKYFHIKRRMG